MAATTIELLGITYVSRESLQEATGCTPDVFVRAEKVDKLPRIKFGKRVFYPKSEVEKWIASRTHLRAA
jgi:predicted DNA-binding transcriptional regulator AlpA